jgi:mRNA interferase MazF
MRRGEVWVANLNPSRGSEIGKVRPVVIMQADELIAAQCPMLVVLPLSTRIHPGLRRFRVTLPARERLLMDSQVVVDQPRSLDRRRLGEGPLTRLSDTEMAAVEQSLMGVLGLM